MKVRWATFYIADTGFECVLSIEGASTGEVLAEAKRIMAEMQKHGVKPVRSRPAPPVSHRTIVGG